MAALNKVASYFADEIRDGIAWVIIWKTDRSWHGYAAWLDPDTETFEPDDLEKAREVLAEDPNAVMLKRLLLRTLRRGHERARNRGRDPLAL